MFQHPDVTMTLADQRAGELRAEAERQRRLTRILHANIENERAARARSTALTLHPLVFWALR